MCAVVEKNNRGCGYKKTCGCIAVAAIRSVSSFNYDYAHSVFEENAFNPMRYTGIYHIMRQINNI